MLCYKQKLKFYYNLAVRKKTSDKSNKRYSLGRDILWEKKMVR